MDNINNLEVWLKSIKVSLNELNSRMDSVDAALNHANPAGYDSAIYKRRENLIRIYSEFLMSKENISRTDAITRSRFEVYEFGDDEITKIIDTGILNGIYWDERRKAEDAFEKSGILEKDAKSYWNVEERGKKKIIPYNLAEPIYHVLFKQNAKIGALIYEYEIEAIDNYRNLVKKKAIILNLVKFGIIKETNNRSFLDDKLYQLLVDDFDKVKEILYEGEGGHDNDFFEENFQKGKLNQIFLVD